MFFSNSDSRIAFNESEVALPAFSEAFDILYGVLYLVY